MPGGILSLYIHCTKKTQKKQTSDLRNRNMGTFCLLLQFLHHKLNAVCLAKKMNKLTALKHKMQVTGYCRNECNNDRHVSRELG